MKYMLKHFVLTAFSYLLLAACSSPIEHELAPLPGLIEDEVPVLTEKETVVLETTAGDVVIEVYPDAAPNAAQRFVELVESGYFDATPISRVANDGSGQPFVAQFGINWREPHVAWRDQPFEDDPRLFAHERGTLAFAKSGAPDTAATQVFINLKENNRLASDEPNLRFTVFGNVVEGMEVVDAFERVGVNPDRGLDQARLWSNGDAFIASLDVKPTMIDRAYLR
jgi:cyclophilin family peptidyl-prolyl cis-trans isomerase